LFNPARQIVWHLRKVVPRPEVPPVCNSWCTYCCCDCILGYLEFMEPIELL